MDGNEEGRKEENKAEYIGRERERKYQSKKTTTTAFSSQHTYRLEHRHTAKKHGMPNNVMQDTYQIQSTDQSITSILKVTHSLGRPGSKDYRGRVREKKKTVE